MLTNIMRMKLGLYRDSQLEDILKKIEQRKEEIMFEIDLMKKARAYYGNRYVQLKEEYLKQEKLYGMIKDECKGI